MRLKTEDKKIITDRIRTGAARLFRQEGYDAVNIDALMGEAGLTRGAFYAHFKTKAVLFSEVVRQEHPLLRLLKARDGTGAAELHRQMLELFGFYLAPENLDEIFSGCSLASLTGDVVRAEDMVKRAHGETLRAVCAEMAREQGHVEETYLAPLMLATAAVRNAQATAEPVLQATLLGCAWRAFKILLPDPKGGER